MPASKNLHNNGQMATPWLYEILLIELLQHFGECSQSRPQMAMARIIKKQTAVEGHQSSETWLANPLQVNLSPDDAGAKD
jgi:hypothetical protein